MKKIVRLCMAVFALAIICYIPVSAASTTWGDANRDETVDVRDLVRTKRYAGGKIDSINKEKVDFNENNQVDSIDVTAMQKLLLGVPYDKLMTKVFEQGSTITINGVSANNQRSKWNLTQEANGIVSTEFSTGGKEQPLYFKGAGTSSDFVAEIYAENLTPLSSAQTELYAGFKFFDGTNTGWVYAHNTGVRWKWGNNDDSSYKNQYGILPQGVLLRDTKIPVKLAFAKIGDQAYIYLNDKLVVQTAWSNISAGAATNTLAVGVMMCADYAGAELRLSDYSIAYGAKEVNKYISEHSNVTLLKNNGMFAEALEVNNKAVTSEISAWDLTNIANGVAKVSKSTGHQKPLYFAQAGDTILASAFIELTEATVNTDPGAGFVITDGTDKGLLLVNKNRIRIKWGTTGWTVKNITTYSNGSNIENFLYKTDDAAATPVELTVAIKDGTIYVYFNSVLVTTLAVNGSSTTSPMGMLPNAKADSMVAVGFLIYADQAHTFQYSDIRFTTDADQVDRYINSNFPEKVSANGHGKFNSNRNKWDLFDESKDTVSTTYRTAADKGKPLFFSTQGVDFAVETTISYTSDITAENMSQYQDQVYAGFQFDDGMGHNGWLYAIRTGIKWNWSSTGGKEGILAAPVLQRDTQLSVKMGVVKQGEDVYVYLNDKLAHTLKYTDIVTSGDPTKQTAVGLKVNVDALATVEFSNIKYTIGSDAAKDYIASKVEYKTGIDPITGAYNTALYGLNGGEVEGADPGVFWDETTGYYYMYTTGHAYNANDTKYRDQDLTNFFARCYRSKDLYQWEECGYYNGYAGAVHKDDWTADKFWAPEVIKYNGKYYMYFSATARTDLGVANNIIDSASDNEYDRMFIGVAVSDSPTGPFSVCYDTDATTGARIPTINFQTGANLTYAWAAIDASPFIDGNNLYLYFNKHTDKNNAQQFPNGIWGVRMTDADTPDYTTAKCLTVAGYKTASSNTLSKNTAVTKGTAFNPDAALGYTGEGGVNEAPQMIKKGSTYYLLYSKCGYTNQRYATMQATGTTPLGTFTKLEVSEGNPIHQGYGLGLANSTGHSTVVEKGGEYFIVYHQHQNASAWGLQRGREIATDRITFVSNGSQQVMTANGPLHGLTWLSESASGYQNLAKTATITVNGVTNQSYLNDGILPYYTLTKSRAATLSGDAEIKLSWSSAVQVNAVMMYNAFAQDNAFSKISKVYFELEDGTCAMIEDLMFPERYYDNAINEYHQCAPAVAEFDTLNVMSITFKIDNADKLGTGTINLSEIVVLGGKAYSDAENAAYGKAHDADMTIDGVLDEAKWSGKAWLEDDEFTHMYRNGVRTEINAEADKVNIKYSGFVTEQGVYIASVVEDDDILSDYRHSASFNSGWEFYVTAKPVGETRGNSGLYTTRFIVGPDGSCISHDMDCQIAVSMDGRINSKATKGATMEMFIPWSALGVDTTQGVPTEFGIMPAYRTFLDEDYADFLSKKDELVADYTEFYGEEATKTIAGTTKIETKYYSSGSSESYYKFNADGYDTFLFIPALPVNGTKVYSNRSSYDLSQEAEGIVVLNNVGDALKGHKLYFDQTGTNFMARAFIEYISEIPEDQKATYQKDVQSGFYISDGTKGVGIYATDDGYRMIPSIGWSGKQDVNVMNYAVLHRDHSQVPVDLKVIVKDGVIYVYVDNKLSPVTHNVAEVIEGYAGGELAVAIASNVDYSCDLRFSKLAMTTDMNRINTYMNSQFPAEVLYSDDMGTIISGRRHWDLWDETEGVITNYAVKGQVGGSGHSEPLYFNMEPATDFVVQMTARNTTVVDPALDVNNYYQNDLMAGFVFNDGYTAEGMTGTAWLVACNDGVRYNWTSRTVCFSEPKLMKDTKNPLTMTMVKSGEDVYIYEDGEFVLKLAWSDIVAEAEFTTTDPVLVGLVMRGDYTANLEISNYSLQTGKEAVKAYMKEHDSVDLEANNMFAESVTVNGVKINSDLAKYDLTEIDDNVIRGYNSQGSALKTVYFHNTGNTAMMQMYIENITTGSNYDTWLSGGFTLHDGINHTHFWVQKSRIQVLEHTNGWNELEKITTNVPTTYLETGNNPKPVLFTAILKDGQVHMYLDNIFIATRDVTALMPNGTASDADLALGITMNTTKSTDIKFSEIEFTQDTTVIEKYMNSQFAQTVTVNGATVSSANRRFWNLFAESTGKLTIDTRSSKNPLRGSYKPLYFSETATDFVVKMSVENVTKFDQRVVDAVSPGIEPTHWTYAYQMDPMVGVVFNDGTGTKYNGASQDIGWLLAVNDTIRCSWSLSTTTVGKVFNDRVLRRDTRIPLNMTIVKKGAEVYIYQDGVLKKTLEWAKVMPANLASDEELAIGLMIFSDGIATVDITNYSLETGTEAAQAYIDNPTGSELKSLLEGKYVSILGDSISTYQGVSNGSTTNNTTIASYNAFYNGDRANYMTSETQTYWGNIISKYGMNLLVNNSCGGNRLMDDSGTGGAVAAGYKRVDELAANTGALAGTKPDIIMINMGTNDFIAGKAVGTLNYSISTSATPTTFAEAYIITLKKAFANYPDAKIMMFTLLPSNYRDDAALLSSYNEAIRALADHYKDKVILVDTAANAGINNSNFVTNKTYSVDGTHPNIDGMTRIAAVVEAALRKAYIQ